MRCLLIKQKMMHPSRVIKLKQAERGREAVQTKVTDSFRMVEPNSLGKSDSSASEREVNSCT